MAGNLGSGHTAALCQPNDQNDKRKHQQQMNRAAKGVAADHSQSPHNEQNKENSQHENLTSYYYLTLAGRLKVGFRQTINLR
jgi:hypothetical protein